MAEGKDVKHYRIGEYAQKMGVTPDLLKHYEKIGLIHSHTTASGYRYYPFTESVPLLECLGLRNLGVSLQEMQGLLYDADYDTASALLKGKLQEMQHQLVMQEAILQAHEHDVRWMEQIRERETFVLLEERPAMLFLPQSREHDFLEDERIAEILGEWINWMPVVKSCRRFSWTGTEWSFSQASWGLAVEEEKAKTYGIPVNGVVERVPGGRTLICHYRMDAGKEDREEPLDVMQDWMTRLFPGKATAAYQTVLLNLHRAQARVRLGWFTVPVGLNV